MSRFGFFLKEALRGLSRSAAPSLAALLTVVLTAITLGVFIPVVQATTGTANEVRGRVVVDVFIKSKATDPQVEELRKGLTAAPNVREVKFISKDDALAAQRKKNPEAFDLLGDTNPLPDVFRVTPEDPDGVNAIVARANGASFAAVDEVRNREEDTNKILEVTGVVKGVAAGLAILLTLASIALIANTIRLSIFARRREVEVMKLVGATNWFIRWPFVIEGVIVGFMGGLAAILLLAILKGTVVDPLSEQLALLQAPNTIDFGLLVAVLLFACVAVSAMGSGITLRRFLRV